MSVYLTNIEKGVEAIVADEVMSDELTPAFSIAVFLGSRAGAGLVYQQQAGDVGRGIAMNGWSLVYGGGDVGCMGAVARGAKEAGGEVIGISTHHLVDREPPLEGIRLEIARDMTRRQQRMIELADVIVALPGGTGTLEELFIATTLFDLDLADHGITILNVNGYYDFLIAHLKRSVDEGFLAKTLMDKLFVSDNVADLMRHLQSVQHAKGKSVPLVGYSG